MTTRMPETGEKGRILEHREDQFLDLKSARAIPAKLQRHFVAFANTDGGELWLGVEDAAKGPSEDRIVGFSNVEEATDLLHVLLELTDPPVEGAEYEFIDFGSHGLVLRIAIPKSSRVHYTSSGDCYIRVGASTRKITGQRVTQLAYAKGIASYEVKPVADTTVGDIVAMGLVQLYQSRIGSTAVTERFLTKQKLVVDSDGVSRPTVACVLLFDDEPSATLPTRCAAKVYRLLTTEREYKREYLESDPLTIEGPLETQIQEIIDTVGSLLEDATYDVGGRLVKLQYPADALKEIIVNAVIHRDYSLNDDVHVRIYDNRIEIESPGRLPGYMTTENILEERFSRNPTIVRMLHKLPNPPNKDIGEGLNTAFNELRRAGLVPPLIEEKENSVLVTVKHEKLASLEDTIMEILETKEFVRNRDVREMTGEESENKVKKALQRLREAGVIEPEDPDASPFKFRYRLVKREG